MERFGFLFYVYPWFVSSLSSWMRQLLLVWEKSLSELHRYSIKFINLIAIYDTSLIHFFCTLWNIFGKTRWTHSSTCYYASFLVSIIFDTFVVYQSTILQRYLLFMTTPTSLLLRTRRSVYFKEYSRCSHVRHLGREGRVKRFVCNRIFSQPRWRSKMKTTEY